MNGYSAKSEMLSQMRIIPLTMIQFVKEQSTITTTTLLRSNPVSLKLNITFAGLQILSPKHYQSSILLLL